MTTAQEALDEWVEYYNTQRPHRSLEDQTPASRFQAAAPRVAEQPRSAEHLVSRKVASNGVVSVGYQEVCIGAQYAGKASDVLVKEGLLQVWVDGQLTKTVARATQGVIRKKHADGQAPRRG